MGKSRRQLAAIPSDSVRKSQAKYWYDGTLKAKNTPPLVKRAYASFCDQRTRCYSPNSHNYKNYGAKGIEVLYCAREFVGWYLEAYKIKTLKEPTCGRKDHSKSYTIDNIEMQERHENCVVDVFRRTGGPSQAWNKPVEFYDPVTGFFIGRFKNLKQGAKAVGCQSAYLGKVCSLPFKKWKVKGFYARFAKT